MNQQFELDFIHLESVDSTMNYAKEHYKTFPKNRITCISATTQNCGRGRYDRVWASPVGNIYVSFVFPWNANLKHLPNVGQILGFSCAQELAKAGLKPQLKWPNDIEVNDKKIGGILVESSNENGELVVIAGIGMNINMTLDELQKIDRPATSLKEETKKTWDEKVILKQLANTFHANLQKLQKDGFSPFQKPFQKQLKHIDQNIRVYSPTHEIEGVCKGICDDGRLLLLLPNGEVQKINSGETSLKKEK